MRVYGKWAGNPNGRMENPALCVAEIYPRGGFISGQCSRERGHGPHGDYCKQHGRMVLEGRHVYVPRRLDGVVE